MGKVFNLAFCFIFQGFVVVRDFCFVSVPRTVRANSIKAGFLATLENTKTKPKQVMKVTSELGTHLDTLHTILRIN